VATRPGLTGRVWHVLEGEFELVVANPAHIRNVPGRKTTLKALIAGPPDGTRRIRWQYPARHQIIEELADGGPGAA
jgi:hypothetical protein